MSRVPKEDYRKIANIYNESGNKIAMEYIGENYGIKAPKGVLNRIKKSPEFIYDAKSNKIMATKSSEETIFMGIEELCNKETSNEISKAATISTTNHKDITLELLYRELMEEKFIELNKYIKLNRYLNIIIIDTTALKLDGYQITIN